MEPWAIYVTVVTVTLSQLYKKLFESIHNWDVDTQVFRCPIFAFCSLEAAWYWPILPDIFTREKRSMRELDNAVPNGISGLARKHWVWVCRLGINTLVCLVCSLFLRWDWQANRARAWLAAVSEAISSLIFGKPLPPPPLFFEGWKKGRRKDPSPPLSMPLFSSTEWKKSS